jgi:hypothetical protein
MMKNKRLVEDLILKLLILYGLGIDFSIWDPSSQQQEHQARNASW